MKIPREPLIKEKEYDELLIWLIQNGYRDKVEKYRPPFSDIATLEKGFICLDIYDREIPLAIRKKIEELFGDNYNITLRKEEIDGCQFSSSTKYIQLWWKI